MHKTVTMALGLVNDAWPDGKCWGRPLTLGLKGRWAGEIGGQRHVGRGSLFEFAEGRPGIAGFRWIPCIASHRRQREMHG